MFGGLVTHVGVIERIEQSGHDTLLWISSSVQDWVLGESVSVDGICLTVTAMDDACFSCMLSAHTLALTTALHYQCGQVVNLERALRLSDRIGGHILTGHVDGTATLAVREALDHCVRMVFECEKNINIDYLIKKGSVAVNGVSLTVNAVGAHDFEVMIIPHTLSETNLSDLLLGDPVNIECDQQVKTIISYMNKCGVYV